MYADFIVVSGRTTWKIAQTSRKDVLQVMFYVGSIVRFCFASCVLEGSLLILVSGLYWYFICVVSSSFRKSFLDSFEMTYLNYILDLQKKKTVCVHFTCRAQCVSLTYLLIYLITSLLTYEYLANQEIPRIFGTRRFITILTSARHLFLFWANSIQSSQTPSHFLKIHLNIILLSKSGSPQWSLSLRFPHQNPLHPSPLPHTRHMPHPSHSSRFYHPHNIR